MAVGTAFNTGQVTLASTPTLIVPVNGNRIRLTVFNAGGNTCYLGGPSVSAANGSQVPGSPGYQVMFRSASAVYGVAASGTNVVSYIEEVA